MTDQARLANTTTRAHPHNLGWLGTTALAMGGGNQSIFILGALLIGQGNIPGQGTAAIALLMVGVLLGCAAVPGWIELLLMYPKRVGGVSRRRVPKRFARTALSSRIWRAVVTGGAGCRHRAFAPCWRRQQFRRGISRNSP